MEHTLQSSTYEQIRKFYENARFVRDHTSGKTNIVVCDITTMIFRNEDSLIFPKNQMIYENRHITLEILEEVLSKLNIGYTKISTYGSYFIINSPIFK